MRRGSAPFFFLSVLRETSPGKELIERRNPAGGAAMRAKQRPARKEQERDGTEPTRTHAVSSLRGGRIQDADTEAEGLG